MRRIVPWHVAILFVLTFSFLLAGCSQMGCGSTPESFVKKADNFFEQAGEATYPVNDDSWKYYDERLKELVEVCYPEHEDALSGPERRKFWTQVSGYYVQRYGKAGARGLLESLGRVLDGSK